MINFELVGCELFGYGRNWRPTGQVSLRVVDGYLCADALLPDVTIQGQVVMFLQVGGEVLKLYSAMLPVEHGRVLSAFPSPGEMERA